MTPDPIYAEIEQRFGFYLPEDYRKMEQRGWFTSDGPGTWENTLRPGDDYLWVPEMEWLSLADIQNHQFQHDEQEYFVPFAFNGRGDHWCWWPGQTVNGITPILLCPHDSDTATLYAPHLLGAIYRNILEYAANGALEPSDLPDARKMFARWVTDLGPLFPPAWTQELEALREAPLQSWMVHKLECTGLLLPEEAHALIQDHLAFNGLDEEVYWHRDET